MHDLTGIQRDLLYSIAGLNRPNGLEVGAGLEEYYNSEINSAQLSPNLDSMVPKGLVEKGQRDNRANWYALTAKGRQKIEARQDWEAQYPSLKDYVVSNKRRVRYECLMKTAWVKSSVAVRNGVLNTERVYIT